MCMVVTISCMSGIEKRSRKQAVSIGAGDDLAAVQVSGQDQVIAGVAEFLPHARIVSAHDADMPIARCRGFGA
jgi:hypothetical protein